MADAPDTVFALPLSEGTRLVLTLLWRHVNPSAGDTCVWPSNRRLAQLVGMHDRSIRRFLERLVETGAIRLLPQRPERAMEPGECWELNPDPSVPYPDPPVRKSDSRVRRRTHETGPTGPRDRTHRSVNEDSSVRNPGPTGPREHKGNPKEPELEPQAPTPPGSTSDSPSEAPKSRRSKGFDPTPAEHAQLEQILAALHEARRAAGMPVPAKPYRVGPTHARAFLGRLRELVADDEPDPAALLVAIVRAKVHEHAQADDERKRRGQYATGESMCRPSWWTNNLEAGRAWLTRGGQPKPSGRTTKSGAYVPRGEIEL